MKKIIYIIIITLLFSSCEKVIDIDLNSADPQIVIEGVLTTREGPYTVKITQTTDYFEPADYPTISNAIVNITDSEGNFETLIEVNPGVYQTSSLQGVEGRTYDLYVNIGGDEYTASSYMPPATPIDSLEYEEIEIGFGGRGNENNYAVIAHFTDTESIENYYRIKYYINSESDGEIHVIDDQLLDGNDIEYGSMLEDVKSSDEVIVELLGIDENVYDYFNTLATILGDGQGPSSGSTTPSNPNSNISNGALGYFAAYSSVKQSIVIN